MRRPNCGADVFSEAAPRGYGGPVDRPPAGAGPPLRAAVFRRIQAAAEGANKDSPKRRAASPRSPMALRAAPLVAAKRMAGAGGLGHRAAFSRHDATVEPPDGRRNELQTAHAALDGRLAEGDDGVFSRGAVAVDFDRVTP